jgi:hypothetical protein
MHQKAQKTLFCDVTKVENFDKKWLTLSKENQKSPLKHIRFGRSKSPMKGLMKKKSRICKKFPALWTRASESGLFNQIFDSVSVI